MRSQRRAKFSQRSLQQRIGLVALAVVQVGLLIAAEVDIQRRPDDQLIGRRLWWRAVCLINILGPLTYFRWGRKRPSLGHPAEAQAETAR